MTLLQSLVIGIDTIASAFFGQWYQTTDLGHYLDNSSAYVVYESETTGEWNLGDRNVFSISGNSFRQNKYRLNGMRIDSRTMAGHTMLHTQMDRTSLALDYHDGTLTFIDDTVQKQRIRLTGNVGNLGGISPGTKQLINLFHKSAEERTIDDRPMKMREHVIGAGTFDGTFAIPINGHRYYQHAYVNYGQRRLTAMDQTGISGMFTSPYYTAQVDGELPLTGHAYDSRRQLRYFVVATGRGDYGSEFYFNRNELAEQRAYHAGVYFTEYLENGGTLIAGLSYEQNQLIHDTLSLARNVMDHDGDAFEPWYPDGRLHSVNLSVRYDQPLLSWLRLQAEGYNSVLHFRPMKTEWTNDMYAQSIDDLTPKPLYTYHWSSEAFSGGILENEAKVIAEHNPVNGLNLYGHVGVSLDGIILGGGKTIVTPNWLAKVAMSYEPVWWFRFGLSVSHHRMSYTWDEMRYLSNAYMNGEIRYADNTLLATTGGFNHRIDKNLWKHQPSYAVVDLPITFTFGKSHRHQIELLNSYRVYYNQWFTQFTDGVEANMTKVDDVWYYTPGAKDYTLTTQPLDLLSSQPGALTPFYLSNTVRYTYTGRKWFVQLSWQSFMQSGFSTLGNGPLHNNLGALSESTANPNTFTADREGSLPFQGNGRINQDKGFIARLQVTYNTCRYFSLGLNFKFKDGQPFTNFVTRTQQIEGQNQLVVLPIDARGTNPANNHFGKRKDAFFNLELRATGRWWANGVPMSLEAMCYNLYDFGTALTEYTFDENTSIPGRTTMSMCIPRGLLFTFRVGLEKDKVSL